MLLLNGWLTSRRFQQKDACLFCSHAWDCIEHFRECPRIAQVYSDFGIPQDLLLIHTPPDLRTHALYILHALHTYHLNRHHGMPLTTNLTRTIHRHLQASGHHVPLTGLYPSLRPPPSSPSRDAIPSPPASISHPSPRPSSPPAPTRRGQLQPRDSLPLHHARHTSVRAHARSRSPPIPPSYPRHRPPASPPPVSSLPRPPEPAPSPTIDQRKRGGTRGSQSVPNLFPRQLTAGMYICTKQQH